MNSNAPRFGPRPLPLHAFAAWRASLLALAAAGGADLLDAKTRQKIQATNDSEDGRMQLARALLHENGRRWGAFWEGVGRYHAHPYKRAPSDRPVYWQSGKTRVLDFAPGSAGRPVLAVPSLVNSSDVLDLLPGRSLMEALAAAGFKPLLVDWNGPESSPGDWTIDRYVSERLRPTIAHIVQTEGDPPLVLGYCMGGLLATAAAAEAQEDVAGLALLATPWDFHAPDAAKAQMLASMAGAFRAAAAGDGAAPVDMLQALFFTLDPTLAARKYRVFAGEDQSSPAAELFVAMEDWVNSGPPLAAPVAETVLTEWYGKNAIVNGEWRINGRIVDAKSFQGPTLVAAPARDRIVPRASAKAFAQRSPTAQVLDVDAGHVGMIVGDRAPTALWTPLIEWLKHQN